MGGINDHDSYTATRIHKHSTQKFQKLYWKGSLPRQFRAFSQRAIFKNKSAAQLHQTTITGQRLLNIKTEWVKNSTYFIIINAPEKYIRHTLVYTLNTSVFPKG